MSIIVKQPTEISAKAKKRETLREHLDRCQAYRRLRKQIIVKRRKPKRRCASTEAMRWLKDKMFGHVYGENVLGNVYPSMTKESFIGFFNQARHGKKLPNYKLQDHFDGVRTHYYFSNPNKTAEYALAMIDIDVQKSKKRGSPEGAKKFAAFLQTKFPSLYFESSTNGKGQHGYLLIRKPGISAEHVKAAMKHLETYLQQQAKGHDIELVEVKGTPPIVKYENGGFIGSITYGSFAKIPRDASRFAEWQQTTVMTMSEIFGLPLDEDVAVPDIQPKVKRNHVGSISGKNIGQNEIDVMLTWERLFKQARKNVPLYGGRWTVTETDFAQAVVLLRFFTENPNPDGSLPQKRVQELWTALFDAGEFIRPWNHHRWKALRDWMSQMGWLEWQDHRYQVGTGHGDGQACKWALHEAFMRQLELYQEEGETSFMDTNEISKGQGQPLVPVKCWFKYVEMAQLWLEAEKACEKLYAA